MTDNVLEIQNLSVVYRTRTGVVQALRNVDLSVPRGKVLGLVGESGCGKSTLVSSIMRLMASNAEVSGRILFEGRDLLALCDQAMRNLRGDRISIVFQDPMTTLNPVLTIGTQMVDIQFRSTERKRVKRRRAVQMLSRVGIPEAESRLPDYPQQLSGGMRQRVCIAMALLSEPALLIADEPTTALDATLESEILRLLKELQQRMGCCVLFISHHLGVVAEISDFVTVMYAGEIAESGTLAEVFRDPLHPYTRKLLECDPAHLSEKTPQLPTIPGEVPNLVTLPEGCIFQDRCPEVFRRCRTLRPALRRAGASRRVACHLEAEATP